MEGSNMFRLSLIGKHLSSPGLERRRWVADRFSRRSPLERALPWMSWGAIDWMEKNLQPGMRVFEWGGGGSTLFLASKKCLVTTVESSPKWTDAIKARLSAMEWDERVEIRLIEAESKDPVKVSEYIRSIEQGAPWDVVLVDGLEEPFLSRVPCVELARAAIRQGGVLLLDDSYRSAYASVPELLKGWQRKSFRGFGPSRIGVTQTDVYISQ